MMDIPNQNSKENGVKYEKLFSYEKILSEKYKLNVSFIKYPNEDYILVEPKKYVGYKLRWENRGKFKIKPTVLEEILNEYNEKKDNLSINIVEEIIETDKPKDILNIETETDKERSEIVYGKLDESLGKNRKLRIILSLKDGIKYISMETRMRNTDNKFLFDITKSIKMPFNRLERILRRAKEIKAQEKI
jgi:hypothetical protein